MPCYTGRGDMPFCLKNVLCETSCCCTGSNQPSSMVPQRLIQHQAAAAAALWNA